MNLRTLKKLSKRAAPYLSRLGDTRDQFPAIKGDSYHGMIIRDMARLDRCASCHTDIISKETHVATIAPKAREGSKYPYVKLSLPCHPIKGTIMVGSVQGYYQPEWHEETAWTALRSWVVGNFFDYDPETNTAFYTRTFRGPRDIFAAADELLNHST